MITYLEIFKIKTNLSYVCLKAHDSEVSQDLGHMRHFQPLNLILCCPSSSGQSRP